MQYAAKSVVNKSNYNVIQVQLQRWYW